MNIKSSSKINGCDINNKDNHIKIRNVENIAIVWTQLQQILLAAILSDQNRSVNVLFVREGLPILECLSRRSIKILNVPNTPFSIKSISQYRKTLTKIIRPAIANIKNYRCYTWTCDNPLARSLIYDSRCSAVNFFEDGTGTYNNLGPYSYKLGIKHTLTTLIIRACMFNLAIQLVSFRRRRSSFYLLYPDAMYKIGAELRQVSQRFYKEAILESMQSTYENCDIPCNSLVYLTSPFMIKDEVARAIHLRALLKLEKTRSDKYEQVFWKPHPRADLQREVALAESISKEMGLNIKLLPSGISSEQLALHNSEKKIIFASVASSSIYTLQALDIKNHELICIDSLALRKCFGYLDALYEFYRNIGIKLLS